MTKRKQTSSSRDAMEKVQLTESLLKCYSCAVEPDAQEVARAIELGIDIKTLKEVNEDDAASTY